jgi:hypothetical protein
MKNKTDYKILIASTADEISILVTDYLHQGWTLRGSPQANRDLTLFAQAVVKEEYPWERPLAGENDTWKKGKKEVPRMIRDDD